MATPDLEALLLSLEERLAAVIKKEVADNFDVKISHFLHMEPALPGAHLRSHALKSAGSSRAAPFPDHHESAADGPIDVITEGGAHGSHASEVHEDVWTSKRSSVRSTTILSKVMGSIGRSVPRSTEVASSITLNEDEYLRMARTRSQILRKEQLASHSRGELHPPPPPPCRARRIVMDIVKSGTFEFFWFSVIFANAALLGAQVEMTARDIPDEAGFQIADIIFTALFLLELFLRLFADGSPYYFFVSSPARGWNIFDTVVVTCTSLDLFLTVLFGSFLAKARSLRLLRLVRVLRAARGLKLIQHVAPLRMLIQSILGTTRTLIWAMVLLFAMTFVFAIVFTDTITAALKDPSTGLESTSFFGGLSSSMLILLWAVVGGTDCWVVTEELAKAGEGWAYVFVLYVSVSVFAVLNVMTAMFVQSAMESAGKDHELVASAWNENKANLASDLERLFSSLRGQIEGVISLDDLELAVQDSWIKDFFNAMEIEVSEVASLFRLLDHSGDGLIDGKEFVEGCIKLRGAAKSIDVTSIKWDVRGLREQVRALSEALRALAKTQEVDSQRSGFNEPPLLTQGRFSFV